MSIESIIFIQFILDFCCTDLQYGHFHKFLLHIFSQNAVFLHISTYAPKILYAKYTAKNHNSSIQLLDLCTYKLYTIYTVSDTKITLTERYGYIDFICTIECSLFVRRIL